VLHTVAASGVPMGFGRICINLRNATAPNLALCVVLSLALPIAAPRAGLAGGCALPAQGEGLVAAIIDSRTIRLDDGREIRLDAIEPVPETVAALAALLGHQVTLHGGSDMPDRYGRQPALLYLDPATSAQRLLLQQGAALVGGRVGDAGCRTELLSAEREARTARRGVWASNSAIKNAENSGDILAGIGRFNVVEGRVESVREARATHYLNFARRWTGGFAVTISRPSAAALEAAGIGLKSLQGQRIRVRGVIGQRGGPQIDVRHIGQLEVLGEN
jgi:endonuclease YncB( thermonuclease family)